MNSPPMEGSSAQKNGLRKGELVTEINGRSTKGMTAFDVIEMVMPDPSKTMSMKLQDPASKEARVVVLDRAIADVKNPVNYKLLEKTGYIRLAEFNALAPQKVWRIRRSHTLPYHPLQPPPYRR